MKTSPGRWKPSSAAIQGSDRTRTTTARTIRTGSPGSRGWNEAPARRDRGDGQSEGERDTDARNEVLPARVEVRLADERTASSRRGRSPAPAIHQARRGRSLIATSTSTIATSANGQLVCTAARLSPRPRPSPVDVVELGCVDPRVRDDDREQRQQPDGPDGQGLALSTPSHRATLLRPSKLVAAVPRLFLSPPHLSGAELDLLRDAIESNWIAPLGPHVDAFEAELAAATGAPQRPRALERHRRAPPRAGRPRDRGRRRGRVLHADLRRERQPDRLQRGARRSSSTATTAG